MFLAFWQRRPGSLQSLLLPEFIYNVARLRHSWPPDKVRAAVGSRLLQRSAMNHSQWRGFGGGSGLVHPVHQDRTRNARAWRKNHLFCCMWGAGSHLFSVSFLFKTIKRLIRLSSVNVSFWFPPGFAKSSCLKKNWEPRQKWWHPGSMVVQQVVSLSHSSRVPNFCAAFQDSHISQKHWIR